MRREFSKITELEEHIKIRTCESQRRYKIHFMRENVNPEKLGNH